MATPAGNWRSVDSFGANQPLTNVRRTASGDDGAGSKAASSSGAWIAGANGLCKSGATLVNRQSSVRGVGNGSSRNRVLAVCRSA
jgi:hypothetical protein